MVVLGGPSVDLDQRKRCFDGTGRDSRITRRCECAEPVSRPPAAELRQEQGSDVRFWPKADMGAAVADVRI
jgi:hypothetical protein